MKRKKTIRAGRLVRTVIYTAPSRRDPPRVRAGRRRASSAAQAKLNVRTSRDKLELLLACNFGAGDLWITPTYSDQHLPPDRDGARKILQKFIRSLRKIRRDRGQELRYVYCTQTILDDGSQRLHHHMILNGCGPGDFEELRSLWVWGNLRIDHLSEDGEVTRIATYMTHEPLEHGKPKIGEQTWTPCRGLKRPVTETVDVPDDVTLQAPPGALTVENDGMRTEFGEYCFLKYWLPKETSYSYSNLSWGEVLTNEPSRSKVALHVDRPRKTRYTGGEG